MGFDKYSDRILDPKVSARTRTGSRCEGKRETRIRERVDSLIPTYMQAFDVDIADLGYVHFIASLVCLIQGLTLGKADQRSIGIHPSIDPSGAFITTQYPRGPQI